MKLKQFIFAFVAVLLCSVSSTFAQVARIGDTEYATLKEAMTEANKAAGDYTIRLLQNSAEVFTFAQKSDVNITIDGGAAEGVEGKTFSGKIILNAANGKLTFTNAVIAPANSQTIYLGNENNGSENTYTNVAFDKCTLKGSNRSGTIVYGYASNGNSKVTVTNCTADNLAYIVSNRQTGTSSVFVENVEATNMLYFLRTYKCPSVTVKNVTCDAVIPVEVRSDVAGTLTLENVNFNNILYSGAYLYILSDYKGSGNKWTVNLNGTNKFTKGGEAYVDDSWISGFASYEIVAEAKIAERAVYGGLKEVAKDAKSGETVVLLKNSNETVTLPAGVILDKNGFTAPNVTEGENIWGGIAWTLSNDGTLTIKPTTGTPVADPNCGRTYEVGEMPEGVVYHSSGDYATNYYTPYDKSMVKSLVIEEGVTTIGSFALKCPNLTGEVVIPSTVNYVGQSAFQGAPITKLTFAEGATEELCIAVGAFEGLKITELNLNRPAHLHAWAFQRCTEMETAVLSDVEIEPGSKHVKYWYHGEKHANTSSSGSWDSNTFAHNSNLQYIKFGTETGLSQYLSAPNSLAKTPVANGTTLYFGMDVAFAAAEDGDELTLPAGKYSEDININKNITLKGATSEVATYAARTQNSNTVTYTGTMTIGDVDVTIQNIDFVKGNVVKNSKTVKDLTVENCTFVADGLTVYALNLYGVNLTIKNVESTDYAGLLQLAGDGDVVKIENVVINNPSIGLKIDYANSVSIKDVTINGAKQAGILDSNYGEKTYEIEGYTATGASPLGIWDRSTGYKTTFAFSGENDLGENELLLYGAGELVLADGATVKAAEGLTFAHTKGEGYEVAYENGAYSVVEQKNYVAKIGTKGYDTFKDAYVAAKDGDTIELLADVVVPNVTDSKINYNYETAMFEIRKAITIDGNGHKMTADAATASSSKHTLHICKDGAVLKDVIIDNINKTKNVNVYCAQNVVFDNVQILNAKSGSAALTINNSTVITKTAFTAKGNSVDIEIAIGKNITAQNLGLVVEEGTVFSLGSNNVQLGNNDANVNTMGKAVDANGNPYFIAYDKATSYSILGYVITDPGKVYTASQMGGSFSDLTIIADAALNNDLKVKGTLDLNGHHITIADDKKLTASGNLTIKGNGKLGVKTINKGRYTITIEDGAYGIDVTQYCRQGYASLPDLNGYYVVGAKPTAQVNDLGGMVVAEKDYMVYGGSKSGDMPLSFVMQFLADQTADDMKTSPYADWFADFVITFEGLSEEGFTADGCYLAGYYGEFGWVKVPVDGMTVKNGERYPVMLGVGMGQKYDYICSDVKDFRCAMFLTPDVLAANPNISVKLELAVVDNSKASEGALEALVNNEKIYVVGEYTYTADDFKSPVVKEGTWGGIDWTLRYDGSLTIAPTKGTPVADANCGRTYAVGEMPEGVVYHSSGDYATAYYTPYDKNSVKSLVIEEGVTTIGSFALKCPNLTGEVVIPSTVNYVGQSAFQGAPVTKLTFAEGATEELCIAVGAFEGLKITELNLQRPAHLHAWAFQKCTLMETAVLSDVTIEAGSKHVKYWHHGEEHASSNSGTWDSNTFAHNSNLKYIEFGTEAGYNQFVAAPNSSVGFVASNGLTVYFDLQDAVYAAVENPTVKVLKNVTRTEKLFIKDGANVVLEGDGKTITFNNSTYGIAVKESTVTLGEGLNIVANEQTCGLYVQNATVVTKANISTTEDNGYSAVMTHGNHSANLTIEGGAITSGNPAVAAIYWPSEGNLTINGGTITGPTAVYFKSGNIAVNDGTLVANGTAAEYAYVPSGHTPTGDALVIENVGTAGYEAIGTVAINGGEFTSANAAPIASYTAGNEGVAAVKGFVTDGTFNKEIAADLCAAGKKCVAKGDVYGIVDYAAVAQYGTWGGIDWTLTYGGTLTIKPTTGTPTTDNSGKWTYEVGQWPEAVRYNSNGGAAEIALWPYDLLAVKSLVIEEGVTSIGSFAARGFKNLTGEVVIPSTVTYIGQEAFQFSTMTQVTFAEGGTGDLCIAQGAFKNTIIEEIALPADRPSIHLHAWVFQNCHYLKNVTLPANVTGVTGTNHVDYNHNANAQTGGNAGSCAIFADTKVLETITFGSEEVKNLYFSKERGNERIVATVGLTSYSNLATAIEVVNENGGTITMNKNATLADTWTIPAGKEVTIDLNGYTVSAALNGESTTNHIYAIHNYGTLTIKGNAKGVGAIKARGMYNYGKLTLESGTIDAIDGNGGYGVYNQDGSEFVMNGGTVKTSNEDGDAPTEGTDATPMRNESGSKVVINDGTIANVSNYTYAIDNQAGAEVTVNAATVTSVHSTLSNYGTMTINGGTFTCNGLDGISAHALVAWGGSKTTITGGTFDGKDNNNGFNVYAAAGADVVIEGGRFENAYSGSLYGDGSIVVSGGTFFDEIAQKWCADGYVCEESETVEGYYDVVFDPTYGKVAMIGETYYETLAAAITAAKANDVITFIADITEDVTLSKSVTIDGAGKAYTGKMTGNAGLTITIENVAFVNGGFDKTTKGTAANYTFKNCTFDGQGTYAYPIRLYGANTVTVEDCTVKDYMYSFLYIASSTVNVHVKNVTVENCPNYAVYFASGVNNALLENLTVKNSNKGVIYANSANRSFTMKNCKMENVNIAIAGTSSNGVDYTGSITCTMQGENDFGTATLSQYAKVVLVEEEETLATLAAPEGLNVTTNVEHYIVDYTDGVYSVIPDPSYLADLTIVYGVENEHVNEIAKHVDHLTYIREFPEYDYNQWTSLYLPFELSVSDLDPEMYDVAYINNIHSKDNEYDGIIDQMIMEYIHIKSGTLYANTPYLIKAKTEAACSMELVLEDVELYATNDQNVVECASSLVDFKIGGTYKSMNADDVLNAYAGTLKPGATPYAYHTLGGQWWNYDGMQIVPFSLYMHLSIKPGTPYKVSTSALKSIASRVVGEEIDGTTTIYDVEADREENDMIFDLQGRRVLETEKGGIYIKGGKKFIAQ